ncbi:MAG: energy transducer TonB [Bacteroidota bacterium]
MESDHQEIYSERKNPHYNVKASGNYWSVLLVAMILALFFSAILIWVPAPISYKNVELQELDTEKVKFYTETQQIHLIIKFAEETDTISSLMDYYYFLQEKTNMAVLKEEPKPKASAKVKDLQAESATASTKGMNGLLDVPTNKVDRERSVIEEIPLTRGGESEVRYPLIEVERRPSFPGGKPGLEKFIARNKRTPYPLKSQNIKGSVNVRFIVNADGSISDVRILKGLGHGCEEETLRLIEMMPRWEAARNQGKAVAVYEALSIPF